MAIIGIFEEQFPSLKGKTPEEEQIYYCGKVWYYRRTIEEFCIDKQKVKEAIEKSINKWNFSFNVTNEEVIDSLLKELGL